ncbi:hypothetical protein NM688_g1412 [Phlebia brevispora]|uniref:Uncharacterized protein n=1 Tax=Phlebia brevispora TaxID=194682 RepID=A0ACC1TC83_9APHY|nr:hypothetical protein NM688_g1412 [Phlebia brevispora]
MSSTFKPSQSQPYVTHPALHLRDARDAHIVFEAVRLNVLPLVTRRLTTAEREQLTSGNVFVWEEAEHKQGGLERWTDGRRWSQSRMRGDYLYYEEKIDITPEEKDAKAARRARKTLDPFSYQPPPVRRQDRPSKPDGLTKQTYSIQVQSSSYEPPKKLAHCGLLLDDYTRLPVVDNYEYLRNIRIPDGVFFAKGNQTRLSRVLNIGEEHDPHLAYSVEQPGWISPSWPASSSVLGYVHRVHRHVPSTVTLVIVVGGSSHIPILSISARYWRPFRLQTFTSSTFCSGSSTRIVATKPSGSSSGFIRQPVQPSYFRRSEGIEQLPRSTIGCIWLVGIGHLSHAYSLRRGIILRTSEASKQAQSRLKLGEVG